MSFHHQDSSQVASFLHPVNGYRGMLKQKGVEPRNHMKDNLRALKEKESENKIKKEVQASTTKEEFKINKFKEVESKVKHLKTQIYQPENPVNQNYLKSGLSSQRQEIQQVKSKEKAEIIRKETSNIDYKKPPIPKRDETIEIYRPVKDKDYIKQNAKDELKQIATKNQNKLNRNETEEYQKPNEFGKIPKYLKDRKKQWEEEALRQKIEVQKVDECPPGMRLLPEEERLETLRELEKNKETVMTDIRKMPLICDTVVLQKRKTFLENKLLDIEAAIRTFSRKKLYIADDM
ncbi:hypothetical protein ABK040_015603 [Willaertia magna]